MTIPLPIVALLALALAGSALALAAFVWAASTGLLDPTNRGGEVIFDGAIKPSAANDQRLTTND